MDDRDHGTELSPFSGSVVHDGTTVGVQIFREHGMDEGWVLEVVCLKGSSTIWGSTFATDSDAFAAFNEALASAGIEAFGRTAVSLH